MSRRALWTMFGLATMMVLANAYNDDEDDDDNDGCGDWCQVVVGFLVDQFFRQVLLPGLLYLLTSSSLLLWWLGVAMLVALMAWVLYVFFDSLRIYLRATPSKRARMLRKSAARGMGHVASAVVS